MLRRPYLDRRAVVLGGLSLPLIGCDEMGRGTSGGSGGGSGPERVTERIQRVLGNIKIGAIAAQIIGRLIGVPQLVVGGMGVQRVTQIMEAAVAFAAQFESAAVEQSPPPARAASLLDWVFPPAHAAAPLPSPAQASGRAPGLDTVSFLAGPTQLQVQCFNRTETEFLTHNVYTIVRPFNQPRPTSAQELIGSDSLPTFSISMPANGTFELPLPFERPVNQGYAVYTWCLPTGVDPTDQIAAAEARIGPLFYNCDPYDTELAEVVRQAPQSQFSAVEYAIEQRQT